MTRVPLDLETPETWPHPLNSYLDAHHRLFLDWEANNGRVSALAFDRAINGLRSTLQPYALIGWHCTRLTDAEISHIERNGMQLPDAAMLTQRIDALVASHQITSDIGQRLKAKNQASDVNRARMIWFCFFPPRHAGESGIERFFRHWGGEALYNSHENDAITSPVINNIGTPCIIEAYVPIAALEKHGGLSFKIVRRFLVSRGYVTREPVDHEDRINLPLEADDIRRVIRFPEVDFCSLTGCTEWSFPVGQRKITRR